MLLSPLSEPPKHRITPAIYTSLANSLISWANTLQFISAELLAHYKRCEAELMALTEAGIDAAERRELR